MPSSWQEVRQGAMQGILVRSGLSRSKKVPSSASGLEDARATAVRRGLAGGAEVPFSGARAELRECQVMAKRPELPSPQA